MAKTFEVIYQAAGAASGLTVQMDVMKADKTVDDTQSGTMTEIGTTGRYYKSFDADSENWSVQCSDPNGGKATKMYDKASYDAHGVAQLVADVQTAISAVASSITTLGTLVTGIDGKTDSIISDVAAANSALSGITSSLTGIDTKIDKLQSPAGIG